MNIKVISKNKLIIDDFTFKCCIGKNGTSKYKKEGDKKTPIGNFKLGKVYYRHDRVPKPKTNLHTKKILPNLLWCNDTRSNYYNKEIKKSRNLKGEKLFRNDFKYDYFIEIKYNTNKTKIGRGSAIFLHLTKNYSKTAGCIALNKTDMIILLKILKKNSKIKIY